MEILNASWAVAGMDYVGKSQIFKESLQAGMIFQFWPMKYKLHFKIQNVWKQPAARLVQGQSDESTLLTGCLLTSPGRYPAVKNHQDGQAVFPM